ncbi:hypothetical protein [Alkalihalobacillus sp. BA299]|uniref:hypothetical protein n=1 Tax=Alkalihalobacillus sp. BA299 TaxID=2815938 RepID=UPI001ADBB6B6|nr:hypothetical protein [Alkalihalobacillus sp. BA299]
MNRYRTVSSVSTGTVEKVMVNEGEFVYEWEPLFLIKTVNGLTKKVELGVSGVIKMIKVKSGDEVISDMTLAVLEEDTKPTGCD